MNSFKLQYSRAFTLIEMALVLLIVGLIFSTVSPGVKVLMNEAKSEKVETEMLNISIEIDKYFAENGRFPDSLEDIYSPPPLDPWGNPYEYLNIKDAPNKSKGKLRKDKNLVPINSDYDLYSLGPDGKSASPLTANLSKDDIVRGRNGKFIGPATDY